MASVAQEINNMVEQLHEPDQLLILEIVKRFLPDDEATPDDLAAISEARTEYLHGETVSHESIDWG